MEVKTNLRGAQVHGYVATRHLKPAAGPPTRQGASPDDPRRERANLHDGLGAEAHALIGR